VTAGGGGGSSCGAVVSVGADVEGGAPEQAAVRTAARSWGQWRRRIERA
jgi:hypothetical protein